jgi:hypothetical protein
MLRVRLSNRLCRRPGGLRRSPDKLPRTTVLWRTLRRANHPLSPLLDGECRPNFRKICDYDQLRRRDTQIVVARPIRTFFDDRTTPRGAGRIVRRGWMSVARGGTTRIHMRC